MTAQVDNFSFPCYRQLYQYLGETDAMVELTELAARSFLLSAKQSGNVPSFLESATKQHGIFVNLTEVDSLSRHLSRTYIVIVASAVERFLKEFHKEHTALYQKAWTQQNDKDKLDWTFENIAVSRAKAESAVGTDLVCRFKYYWCARNWIVHEKESLTDKPLEKFEALTPFNEENQKAFEVLKAPNKPESLTFDDFILYSRLAKLVAEKMCNIAKPIGEDWKQFGGFERLKKCRNKPDRMRNAISGKLRTDYGMDETTARWIAENIFGSLA